MAEFNPVVWFEIYVQDIEKARKFYEEVLQKKMSELPTPEGVDEMKMLTFADTGDENKGGAMGSLVEMAQVPSGGNSTIVYFGSADCSVEEGRVEAAGGKIFKSKMSIQPHGFISLVTDPDGNMIGFHSMK